MKKVLMIVLGALLVILASIGVLIVVMNFLPEQEGVVSTTAEVEAADPLAEEAPVVALDVGVTETENDVRVFNFTLEDFIASYNGYYWQDEGVRYLLAAEDWAVGGAGDALLLSRRRRKMDAATAACHCARGQRQGRGGRRLLRRAQLQRSVLRAV